MRTRSDGYGVRSATFAWLLFALAFTGSTALHAGPLEDLAPGRWYEVPSSQLKALNPCPANDCSYSSIEGIAAIMDDWNGGAFATGYGTKGGLVVSGGGHMGYFGNELYVFDVGQLKWQRVSNPVENPQCDFSEGELQDRSPCSAHTYDYVDYHPGTNSFVQLGSTSNHTQGGGGSPRVHLFNLTTKQWRRGARRANFADQTGASSAYDSNRDVFWFLAPFNNYFSMYDPNANSGEGSWTLQQQYNIEIDAVAAIDPTRDLYVVIEGRVTHQVIVFDLKRPTAAPVVVRTSGDTAIQASKANGFEWDPSSKAFVGWRGGTSVYMLKPPAGDWKTEAWTWTRVDAAAGNTANPGNPNERGTYSRWRYVPALNVFVVANAVDRNVFFYKLSNAAPLPQVSLQASATDLAVNSSFTLTWNANNADACTASGAWSGSKGTSGSLVINGIKATSTYTLACSSNGGSAVSQSVTVNVAQSVAAPTVTVSAEPSTVAAGGSSVVSWTTSGAATCTASGGTGGWAGSKAASGGSVSISPISASTTFTLSCTGTGGTAQGAATVNLEGAPKVTLTASPTSVASGATTTLTWSSTDATSCSASGAWSGNLGTSGSRASSALNANSTFVLTCTGAGGSSMTSADVTVTAESSPTTPVTPPSAPAEQPAASKGGGGRLDLILLAALGGVLVARRRRAFISKLVSGLSIAAIAGGAQAASLPSIVVTSTGSSAQTQVPVTVGQVFASGDVPSNTSVVATVGGSTSVPLQVDVKARHADGSLRHAILTMRVPSLAASGSTEVMLATGAASGGSAVTLASLLATAFDAKVDLNVGGTTYSSSARALLSSGTPKTWLSGPLVSEWIVGGPLKTSGGATHAHLAAYYHVRAYGGSSVDRVRVDVVVENGWTMVHGPGTFSYAGTITVGGQSVFQSNLSQPHHTRWHKQFWWQNAPQVAVQQDTRYLQATRAVPTYANVAVTESQLNALSQSSTPLSNGDLSPYFPQTGSQQQIGPLPLWAARYIVSNGDPRALRNLLVNDDSAGSYSVHYRDEVTGMPVSIVTHPTLSLQTNDLPAVSGSNQYTEDNAHQPSLGFLSYLLTGDYFYMEEMLFWTSWNELWMNPDYRQQSKGIFGSQVRSQAWSLRNLGQSAYALPDDHPMKSELVASVGHNISNYATLYVNNSSANRLGAVASYDGYTKFSPWQDDFLTWTISYLTDLGFPGQAVRDWKFKFPVGRMGTTEYCYKKAALYTIHSGTSDSAWYSSFSELYTANFGANSSCPEGQTMEGYPDDPAGYPSNLRPALVAAVDNGYPGAAEAWQRFLGSAVQADYSGYPNWALAPRTQLAGSTASLSIAANPAQVSSGGTSQLTWTGSNVSNCTASGAWSGVRATSGSETTAAITSSTTYTLACTGSSGSVQRSVTVTIAGSTPPTSSAPTLTLTSNAQSVAAGGAATLTWSTTGATACTASGGWSGNKSTSGSQSTGALSSTTSFQLDCTGSGGSVSKSVSVAVGDSTTPPAAQPDPPSTPPAQSAEAGKGGGGAIDMGLLVALFAVFVGGSARRFRARGALA